MAREPFAFPTRTSSFSHLIGKYRCSFLHEKQFLTFPLSHHHYHISIVFPPVRTLVFKLELSFVMQMISKSQTTAILYYLNNDPGKKGSIFFCCGAIRFPHIEMFSFLRRECINLQKGCLRKKMYLNSTFKGCIFVLKHFDQSQELQTMAKKCSQFYMIRTYDFCVT